MIKRLNEKWVVQTELQAEQKFVFPWFKLGIYINNDAWPRAILGLGVISLEANWMDWGNGSFEIGFGFHSMFGYIAASFEFREEEELAEGA